MVKASQTKKTAQKDRSAYLAILNVMRQKLANLIKSCNWRRDNEFMTKEQVAKFISFKIFWQRQTR